MTTCMDGFEFVLNLSVNDDDQSDKQSVHKELALYNVASMRHKFLISKIEISQEGQELSLKRCLYFQLVK